MALLLASCTSVRPIVKIGLIAPFEGLYRESGYAALAAMRQAISDCAPVGVDVLPLALDDSGDPAQARRAAQKLLVDPAVRAVVGPLLLDTIPAVAAVMTPTTTIGAGTPPTQAVPWYVPPLITPAGEFGDLTSSAWLDAQIEHVAAQTAATRVVLLGLPSTWPIQPTTTVPVVRVDTLESALTTLQASDAVLWLGRPDIGASWLAPLHQVQPDLSFWLASQAGIDIFAAHTATQGDIAGDTESLDRNPSHWLLWQDFNYNQRSQADTSAIQPNDALHNSVYRATCAALDGLGPAQTTAPRTTMPGVTPNWEVQSLPVTQPEIE